MPGTLRFETELIEGHKGVVVALLPFDPEEAFGKPVALAGRRHGWPVKALLNRTKFDGYVGERWGKCFVIVEPAVRTAARVAVGDGVTITIAPSDDAGVLAHAIEQSSQTTQPSRARTDLRTPTRRSKR